VDALLTVKHVIADFVLQNSWMADRQDQKPGACRCWPCLVHLAVAMTLILIIARNSGSRHHRFSHSHRRRRAKGIAHRYLGNYELRGLDRIGVDQPCITSPAFGLRFHVGNG